MAPGFDFGIRSTSRLMAKVTGRVQRPSRKRAWASLALADANTSAGGPRSICVCSAFDARKLWVGTLLSAGKTLVSDVAAWTLSARAAAGAARAAAAATMMTRVVRR